MREVSILSSNSSPESKWARVPILRSPISCPVQWFLLCVTDILIVSSGEVLWMFLVRRKMDTLVENIWCVELLVSQEGRDRSYRAKQGQYCCRGWETQSHLSSNCQTLTTVAPTYGKPTHLWPNITSCRWWAVMRDRLQKQKWQKQLLYWILFRKWHFNDMKCTDVTVSSYCGLHAWVFIADGVRDCWSTTPCEW